MAESRFPLAYPSPLARQKAMATARAQEFLRPEDSMSSAGSVAGPTASSTVLGEGQGGRSAQPHRSEQSNDQKGATIPEHDPWQDPDEEVVPPNDPQAFFKAADSAPASGWSAFGTAPATQAAKKVLGCCAASRSSPPSSLSRKLEQSRRATRECVGPPCQLEGLRTLRTSSSPPLCNSSGLEKRSAQC